VATFYDQYSVMKADANAWVLSALLFIPESSPTFDVYGKVGVAELDESFSAYAYTLDCAPVSQCLRPLDSAVQQSSECCLHELERRGTFAAPSRRGRLGTRSR